MKRLHVVFLALLLARCSVISCRTNVRNHMICKNSPLKQKYSLSDFLFYKLLAAVPFSIALIAIFEQSIGWSTAYLIWMAFHFVVTYRLLCTHCPHYAAVEDKTCCHFIWGTPPMFKKRPGPLSLGEKAGVFSCSQPFPCSRFTGCGKPPGCWSFTSFQ